MPDNKPVRFAVLAVVVAMAAGLLWLGLVRYQAEQRTAALAALEAQPGSSASAPNQAQAAAQEPAAAASTVEAPPPAPPQVVVHVAGAVSKPGVYKLEEGARVADALAAAGGPLPEAAPDALNLADRLVDGQKVYVMTRQELLSPTPPPAAAGATAGPAPSTPSAAKPAGKVSINTATVQQLDAVPGVTPSVAQAIVAYRTQNGPFKRLEDLDNVKGIGPATIDKLRPLVTL